MKIIKPAFVLAILLIAPVVLAAPVVITVANSVDNGGSIIITGTGFGSKPQAAPWWWDNFEGETPGATISNDYSPYTDHSDLAELPIYSTNFPRSPGAISARQCCQGTSNMAKHNFPGVPNAKAYVSWWFRGTRSGYSVSNKVFNFNPSPSWGPPQYLWGGDANNYRYNVRDVNRQDTMTPENLYTPDPYNNGWHRWEIIINLATSGTYEILVDGDSRGVGAVGNIGADVHSMFFNSYFSYNDASQTFESFTDEIYIDTTMARVEIGNESTFGACTHREIQIPSAWSATEITVTVNTGTFAENDIAYLFVVDSDNIASAGKQIQIGTGLPPDDAPPAPQNLVASNGENYIPLMWEAVPDIDGDLAGYYMYRSTSSNGTYTEVSNLIPEGTTTYNAVVPVTGQTYYFKVRAIDDGDNRSDFSNWASGVMTGDITAPAAPTGLTGTAGIEEAVLTWNEQFEPDLAGYWLYRSDLSDGLFVEVNTTIITGEIYTDSPLVGGQTYYYKLKAADEATNRSGFSNMDRVTVDGVPDDPPAAPTGLAATAGVELIDLIWYANSEPDLAGYHVYRDTVTGGPYKQITMTVLSDTTYTDKPLVAGTEYFYVVKAVDDSGQRSDDSNEDSATPDPVPVTAPDPPTGVQGTAGIEQATITWLPNDPTGLAGYHVLRSGVWYGDYITLNEVIIPETTLEYVDTNLTAHQDYYYKVQAENDGGELSEPSDWVLVTPLPQPVEYSVLAPDSLRVYTGQRFNFPVYAHWGWKTFESGVPLSSEDYAHIAQHDVYHLPQEALIDTIYQSVVDSVRAINPNTVFTVHMQVMGWKPQWETWGQAGGSYYKDIYNLAMAHPTWSVRNVNGDYMVGKSYGTIYWNPYAMDEGLNDSLGVIWDKWTTFRDINRPRVGIFADWIAGNFPGWPFPDSLQHMDFDQDGIPHGTSPDPEWLEDEAKYDARNIDLARGFRENISEPTFLMVPNVLNAKNTMAINNGYLWDGMMFEGFQYYEPSTSLASFKQAVSYVYHGLNNSRVDPPLVFWQGLENTTLTSIEVIGPIMRGLSVFHHHRGTEPYEDAYTLPDDLNLGHMVGEPEWDGNVVTAQFKSNAHTTTVKLLFVEATGGNTLPWDFIVLTASGTVLRRYGDWPDYTSWPGYDQ